MFTGIIESTGKIVGIAKQGSNVNFTIESTISKELKIDQSLAHDGICLTIVAIDSTKSTHTVTAVQETLDKTCLINYKEGYEINLERCMKADGRFDGHIVQGHVDQTTICKNIEDLNGSWKFTFEHEAGNNITVEKGSITVNGVSLTVVDSKENSFSVAIIPYTYEHTNFKNLQKDSVVNLEFDIIGKYITKLLSK